MIKTEHVSVTITGSDGSATGTDETRKPINGKLVSVYVDYNTQPSTTDVVITTKNAPVKPIITLTNANTDTWKNPREIVHDTTGATVTYDGTNEVYDKIAIDDYITITVSQGNAGTLDFVFLYEC